MKFIVYLNGVTILELLSCLTNTIVSILKLNVPIISLTATASPNVLNNIIIELNIKKENVVYRMHLSRPELSYECKNKIKMKIY